MGAYAQLVMILIENYSPESHALAPTSLKLLGGWVSQFAVYLTFYSEQYCSVREGLISDESGQCGRTGKCRKM